ncbi:MAG: hypothetical protein EOO01_28450 [Chitinophagaceae bacterium]|nr:MAG: hypothetical protein EOO01_28450 [Chitinophagaceae bacterium]
MKLTFRLVFISCVALFAACNQKKADEQKALIEKDSIARVTQVSDSVLRIGVAKTIASYPGITASVSNGEIMLQGAVVGDRQPVLLQSLRELDPKQINDKKVVVYR